MITVLAFVATGRGLSRMILEHERGDGARSEPLACVPWMAHDRKRNPPPGQTMTAAPVAVDSERLRTLGLQIGPFGSWG